MHQGRIAAEVIGGLLAKKFLLQANSFPHSWHSEEVCPIEFSVQSENELTISLSYAPTTCTIITYSPKMSLQKKKGLTQVANKCMSSAIAKY